MEMGQEQRIDQYLAGKPYILNRLYFGSVGAELWSSIMIMLHVSSIIILGRLPDIGLSRVLYSVSPVTIYLLGAIALSHFILLWLPNSRITIIQRKVYSCLGLGFWTAVITECIQRGYGGLAISLSIHVLLLTFSIFRRDY